MYFSIRTEDVGRSEAEAFDTKDRERLRSQISTAENKSFKLRDTAKTLADISTQLKMASVSASIEAARAGGAGKSFAVIAAEVARLSALSAETAEALGAAYTEINSSIREVQNILDNTAGE